MDPQHEPYTQLIRSVIDFNPAWLDENGFMRNIAGPFTAGVGHPGSWRVDGFYTVKDGSSMLAMRFRIYENAIFQELPERHYVVVEEDAVSIYQGDFPQNNSISHPFGQQPLVEFYRVIDPDKDDGEMLVLAKRTTTIFRPRLQQHVPLTNRTTLFQLTRHMRRLWDRGCGRLLRDRGYTGYEEPAEKMLQRPSFTKKDFRAGMAWARPDSTLVGFWHEMWTLLDTYRHVNRNDEVTQGAEENEQLFRTRRIRQHYFGEEPRQRIVINKPTVDEAVEIERALTDLSQRLETYVFTTLVKSSRKK